MVELVRSGPTPEEPAKKFEPTAQAIRNWVARADRDAGARADGLTSTEQDDLRRLRREVKVLREEKEVVLVSEESTSTNTVHDRVVTMAAGDTLDVAVGHFLDDSTPVNFTICSSAP